MPVVAEHHDFTNLPSFSHACVFIGAFLLLFLGILITRRSRKTQSSALILSTSEKETLIEDYEEAQPLPPSNIQRPSPPPPFTLPQLDTNENTFSSFEVFQPDTELPPRRRSYTRTTTTGTEVNGEIVVAEGWRRHTKVFGGGVCEACLESERRMSA